MLELHYKEYEEILLW